jgi:Spy/CpxP family protein refolding chaperone
MFGFLFGALCLGGLFALIKGRRYGFHSGWHHRHHFGHGGHGCSRHGFGRFGLNAALDHLDTTPGQEKAIVAALDELRDEAWDLRSKVLESRRTVGGAIRGERLDDAALESLVARHTSDFAAFGARTIAALGKVHEVLDPEQRKRLARLIESVPGWGFAGMR